MKEITYYKGNYQYMVVFEEEKLLNLRKEIINNASSILHVDYYGSSYDSPFLRKEDIDPLEIQNYKSEYIRTEKDLDGKEVKIYHYEYDRYNFPYIESLIKSLLNSDTSVLEDIYNPDLKKESVSIYHKINTLEKRILSTDSRNLNEKLVLLHELEDLLKKAKDTKDETPILNYYERLQELINVEKIPVLNINF